MTTSIARGINDLVAQIDAPIASFFSSCVNCGMCADACLFYTETGDVRYTPIYKVRPLRKIWRQNYTFWGRLGKLLGLSKPLTDAELEEWETLVYDGCTLCGRCTQVCPVGNDITYMIRKLREGMVSSGHTPPTLRGAMIRALEIGSPMGITLKTFKIQVRDAEEEAGVPIPWNVEGAEFMVLMSSAEIMEFPEYLSSIAKIFKQAGVSWTLSEESFDATNTGVQLGSTELATKLVWRIVNAAEKLGVRKVLSPECGHAYTALRWEGPNMIGRPYRFEVVHIMELLDQLRAEGRLRLEGSETRRLTYHDPCQISRRGGVYQEPRRLLDMVAGDFVEMEDPGIWNWCCGGGGGVSANERANPLRSKVFSRKKAQIDKTGAELLVTTCSNCRNMLLDGIENNRMDIEITGLSELLAGHLADTDSKAQGEDEA